MISAKVRRHQEQRRLFEAALRDKRPDRFYEDMKEYFCESATNLGDFSIRLFAENFIKDGREFVQTFCSPHAAGGVQLLEAAEVVDTSAFANIIGQFAYSAVLKAYEQPELIGDKLMDVVQTSFSGEKIPGVTGNMDDVESIPEGGEYPNSTFMERWVETPETTKRGKILGITKEAVFFDRTNLVLSQAGGIGRDLAINREKRMLDVVFGITTTFRRNGGAAEATFASDNTSTSNTLADWVSINTAAQKLNEMTDPDTGELIAVQATHLVVPKALEQTARRIVNATMIRQTSSGGNTNTYVNDNQLSQNFDVVSGPYVKNRTSSDSTWFFGNPKAAFCYMQNWPLTLTQSKENSEADFTRDIMARFKISERGTPAVKERKFMLKCTP